MKNTAVHLHKAINEIHTHLEVCPSAGTVQRVDHFAAAPIRIMQCAGGCGLHESLACLGRKIVHINKVKSEYVQ